MAKIEALDEVSVFTRDQKKSRQFYVNKIGLKVRSEMKDFGYLALGATKGGKDASIDLWEPDEDSFGPGYEAAMKSIGTVTGIGFESTNLAKTVEGLKKRGVKVEMYEEGGDFASFSDPDGNVLFIEQPRRPKVRRAGLASVSFVTVVTRDEARSREFFSKALGLKANRVPGEGRQFVGFRAQRDGTVVMPFTPKRETYTNPADYDADLAHIGEATWIMFRTKDIYGLQEELMARGVRFKRKAEGQEWGGIDAEFLDPDENTYLLVQPRPRR